MVPIQADCDLNKIGCASTSMRSVKNSVNTDFTGMTAEYVNNVNAEQYSLLLPAVEALCLNQGCLFQVHLLVLIEIITS